MPEAQPSVGFLQKFTVVKGFSRELWITLAVKMLSYAAYAVTNFTLKQLEDRLDSEVFFRAHKSRLVNLTKVKAIVPWFGGRFKLVMRDQAGSEVELSRIQARALRSRMRW